MATLEDRILGEKLEYYCSSSEDEAESDDEGDDKAKGPSTLKEASVAPVENELRSWEGSSTNTGPKGVLKDWQRFKQLETEKRRDQERERLELAKKLAMSCKSNLDDEKDKEKQKEEEEDDVDRLIDEEFLRQYIAKRMDEMMATTSMKAQFGSLLTLDSGVTYLDAIDNEDKDVTIVIHIYDQEAAGCDAMNGCLACLAREYPNVKFCKMQASTAGVSTHFKGRGLPALLIYKAGQLMGNFVRLTDEFGEDFYATDVESFLIEHGMLIDKSLVPPGATIKGPSIMKADDNDSDYSLED